MNKIKTFVILTLFTGLMIAISYFTTASTEAVVVDVESSLESVYVDEIVYPHDEVIDVNIEIDEDDLAELRANALDEEYYLCDITYNGVTLTNVAIRTKGNSSLRDVFNSGGDRFSYTVDLNYYLDQDLYGIDKLVLNNLFKDPSMMAEFIGYEVLDSLDATASRTTYTALSINGEYYGLYLSVESIGNEYLDVNFGNSDGELYKPEMGTGSDLDYVTDDGSYYTGLFDENSGDTSNEAIVELMARIESGEDLDEVLNVESFLKYLAMSTYTIHLDNYQSGMNHNYYLYNNEGVFEWISWDLNMIFNGFDRASLTDAEATQFLIDEPVIGNVSSYPIVETILANEEYLAIYHGYLQDLTDTYFEQDNFDTRLLEIYTMIEDYVQIDANAFYSHSTFTTSVFSEVQSSYSLTTFIEQRTDNIEQQILGEIPSTNDGEGNGSTSQSTPGGMTRPGGNVTMPNDNIVDEVIDIDPNDLEDDFTSELSALTFLALAGVVAFTIYLNKKKM